MNLEKDLIWEYNDVLKQEEIHWFQKSRIKWILDGESNTKFFHQTTLARRRVNKIFMLKVDGEWMDNQELLKQHGRSHFENIFGPPIPPANSRINRLARSVHQARITRDEFHMLQAQFTEKEVKSAVWASHPTKAPGPDGLQAFFYQQCWTEVGPSVVSFIQQAFQMGRFDPSMCDAFVCLIPKVSSPSTTAEYRPIALCNVLYKFITKCITMRLKHIMPELISQCQSSFISGRSTQHNVFVMQEILHSLRAKKKNKVGCVVMKLDLEKAYDRVNWEFLEDTLEAFNFPRNLITLVMFCVRSSKS